LNLSFLNEFHLEDIQNSSHPSDFYSYKDYSVLIIRIPEVSSKKIDIISYAFIIRGNRAYLYDRDKNKLKDISSLLEIGKFLNSKIEKLLKDVMRYHYQIECLEDELYEDNIKEDFINRVMRYKKDISLIYRVLLFAILALELFISHFKHSKDYPKLAYDDLLEHMKRIRNLSKSANEKLDNLYNFYKAKIDEKMNRNIYYLTILSGIFLPLTLVTGFFGMNTGGLPLTDNENGTLYVVIISIVLEVIFLLPLFYSKLKEKLIK